MNENQQYFGYKNENTWNCDILIFDNFRAIGFLLEWNGLADRSPAVPGIEVGTF